MTILRIGAYKCEACMHFDTDGIDGNHPSCMKQPYSLHNITIRIDEECPFGYEFGVPAGYSASIERNKERAYKVKAMMKRHDKVV